ncbi:hypothetical protein ES707_06256 [subsurface metagenome]
MNELKDTDRILKSKLERVTIRYQNEIINRLRLYVFAKSAITLYCKDRLSQFEGYDFTDFKLKFKLVDFHEDKEIKRISYKDMVKTGEDFVSNELTDAIYVLNTSTFENWLLTILKQKLLINKSSIYSDMSRIRKGDEDYARIDVAMVRGVSTLEELWGNIVDKYLRSLPYDGIKKVMGKFLNVFKIGKETITPNIFDKINEVYLCRNAIVHNRKKVGNDYIEKSGKFARFKLDDVIVLTEDVLFEQADNLLRFMQDFRKSL